MKRNQIIKDRVIKYINSSIILLCNTISMDVSVCSYMVEYLNNYKDKIVKLKHIITKN